MKKGAIRALSILCISIIIIDLIIVAIGKACYSINPNIFDSGKPGMTLVVISGIHGNEQSGIHALKQIINKGNNIVKNGKLIIIPYANWCGVIKNIRKVPEKDKNTDLNRMFITSNATGLSGEILKYINQADYVLDLHESKNYYKRNQIK